MYILWRCFIMGLVSLGNLFSWMLSYCQLCGTCWPHFHKNSVFKILYALLLFNIMFEYGITCLEKMKCICKYLICIKIVFNMFNSLTEWLL